MTNQENKLITGQDIVAEARKYIGQSYVLGALPFRKYPNSQGPWDCAEFTSYVVYKLTQQPYGIINPSAEVSRYDAWTNAWKSDSEKYGKIISISEAANTTGAAVLRYTVSGRIGHIAFSDGSGGTVEAHSRNRGVTTDKISGRSWNTGILVPWIDYACKGNCQFIPPTSLIFRLTKPLMQHPLIGKLQGILRGLALYHYPLINGGETKKYGPLTEAGVVNYQTQFGLLIDGQAGPETLGHMKLL